MPEQPLYSVRPMQRRLITWFAIFGSVAQGASLPTWFICVLTAVLSLATAIPVASAQTAAAVTTLPEVAVSVPPTLMQKYQLPGTAESMTNSQMAETVNVMNSED